MLKFLLKCNNYFAVNLQVRLLHSSFLDYCAATELNSEEMSGNEDEDEDLTVTDVADLLQQQFAVITGGKSVEGYPLITLPDLGNFGNLSDSDYQKLILYLTSVPPMHEADMGFVLVVDRRNDKWSSVKSALLKVSGYFPGLIHIVYVLRPSGFLQKAISEVSNKLFKEEFKFRVVVCGCVEELHHFIEKSELTADLDGSMPYSHQQWIEQRIALEQFSCQTKAVSQSLDSFTQRLRDSTLDLVLSLEEARELLEMQREEYEALKEEILSAAQCGEALLGDIRQRATASSSSATASSAAPSSSPHHPSSLSNITAVERLLVQLEETERTFDDFWDQHSARLRQYLEFSIPTIRNIALGGGIATRYALTRPFIIIIIIACYMINTFTRTENLSSVVLYVFLGAYYKTQGAEGHQVQRVWCFTEIERAEELVSRGQTLLRGRHYLHLQCVTPKCEELQRMCITLSERLQKRSETLAKYRDLQEQVDKANKWCARGVELLASQHIEKCSCSAELAEAALADIQAFVASAAQFKLSSPREFHTLFQESITPETKALVTQVLQRVDDVSTMCDKRITSLKKLVQKPPRPVQTVTPEPAVPIQSPNPNRISLSLPKSQIVERVEEACSSSNKDNDVSKAKRHHVLTELLETERIYVSELGSILKGYKSAMSSDDMRLLLPPGLEEKSDILFGNLDEIHQFHGEVFLQDLENCISTTELVALCFTHRRESFHRLYSYYCQNIPRSERLRSTVGDNNAFFQACQLKLGHKLPLAAYLLKPVQRITKYQLLLKDLLQYSEEEKWCGELKEALDCMLVVLKCVNDSMHQIAITGFWGELAEQGELLMQGSFNVWTESKKDLLRELRLKPMQRHIFLYQKAMLFCKKTTSHKSTYHFKHYLKMSEVGLTETVKGDGRTFEVWLPGRQEVHTIQAATTQQKAAWVEQVKKLLFDQLAQLKIRQFSSTKIHHVALRQACSLDTVGPRGQGGDDGVGPCRSQSTAGDEDAAWSSDYTNSDDDDPPMGGSGGGGRYIALADYCAVGHSEVSMKEGDVVQLIKVGCAGWWYVRLIGGPQSQLEGWVPAAYVEPYSRKSSRSCQSVSSQASSLNE
ncbi:guanine nucleotide exchange factor DBS [Nilaparvata lugens]|uniref:guanine nucleotide exchange factor DBS n=1 Tax=Nilaparvata lugens TaxID=108931 RepID=UPI00193D351C|nr:guanine nucleotide exchange factor DBS [Nilaparvata lugens]